MNRIHKSFKFKFVSLCMVALIAVMVVVHVAVYVTTKNIIENECSNSAQGIAVAVAHSIMKNTDAYKAFIESFVDADDPDAGYYSDAYYQAMWAYFAEIKQHSNVKYLYTERRIDADTIEFVLDAEPLGAPDHSPPTSRNPNDPWRESVYATGQPSMFGFTHYDQWGSLLGAYAPIFDSNGDLLGLVGVNIEGSYLYRHLSMLQMVMLGVYAFILFTAFLLLTKYSSAILEPMFKDKLTGAYIKRHAEKLIQGEIDGAVKGRRDLALFVLDLDHFKKINDTYGHGFGDKVLSTFAVTISGSLRQHDHFIRYGGEEFLLVIPNANEERSKGIAERLRRIVEEIVIFNEEHAISVRITVSIGVANLDRPVVRAQELIENADKALYAAKETRNSVRFFRTLTPRQKP